MELIRFLGLDERSGRRPAGALAVADNCRIDTNGTIVRRPALVRQATLPAASAGLYSVDDTLRACAPNGTSTSGLTPAVMLDYLDASSVAGRVQAARLPSGIRALWVESDSGGPPALHLTHPLAATERIGSRIVLPWTPFGVVCLGGRLLSLDRQRGLLPWSGVADPDVNGGEGHVRTWDVLGGVDTSAEGGFAFVAQVGSEPRAIAEYQGALAVFSLGAVQILEISAAGASGVTATIAGPGTRHPGAIATMSGDVLYVDAGGRVRLLSQDQDSGGVGETSPGEPVATRVAGLTGYADLPVAVYSRGLGCYLLASGQTVMCLSILPGVGPLGWSRWTLPVPVDAITENRGVVQLRSGQALYGLYDHVPKDEVDTGDLRDIDMEVEPAQVGAGLTMATPTAAAAICTHPFRIAVRRDGILTVESTLPGRSPKPAIRRGSWPGNRHSLRVRIPAAPPGARIEALVLE